MESRNLNGPNYNLRLSSHALESLPKHERPLRIKIGAINNPLAPKVEESLPAQNLPAPPSNPKVVGPEQKCPADADARPARGNNVYINVNIFFSKGVPDIALGKPPAEEKEPAVRKGGPVAPAQAQNQENVRKSQEESASPLRLFNRPVEQVKPVKPVSGPSNQISSLFENSRSSDHNEHADFAPLRKREAKEIKCACHHLHVNDNVKISRFSYKSQLRKIRVRWAGLVGDFPIVFKRKLARFEDDSESVSINEIVDFSKKLIQPEGENDIFGMGEHF